MALLEVKDLSVYYGVICALKGISFEVNEGEIVSLIGANGAGKTTMMQSVVGMIPKKSGTVIFDGKDISKMPCHKIVQLGMTQVPEGRRIFQELSVYENLMMGAYSVRSQQRFKEDLESVFDRFPRLAERRTQIAGTLSGGLSQLDTAFRQKLGIRTGDQNCFADVQRQAVELPFADEVGHRFADEVALHQLHDLGLHLGRHIELCIAEKLLPAFAAAGADQFPGLQLGGGISGISQLVADIQI